MAQTAAHLVDHVLPHGVGYRQWVLTLPFDLRYRVAYDAELGRAILRAFVKTLSAWQLERAGESGIESAQWGAVTVVQRFGSALQLMPHFHTVGCDGAFSVDADGEAQVHTLSGPTSEDVERLVEQVHGRVLALLRRRGLVPDEQVDSELDPLSSEAPTLAACYAAALVAPKQRLDSEAWTQSPGARAVSKSPLCARFGGFDLHAGVSVAADDRYGLERLCRYLSRPALSHDRLEQLDEEHVGLQLKTPYSDGTTHLVLTFDELLQRLCALVPRPRTHRVRFHGILAPAAKHRADVVPEPHSGLLPESEATAAPVEHNETTTHGVHDAAEPEILDARGERRAYAEVREGAEVALGTAPPACSRESTPSSVQNVRARCG